MPVTDVGIACGFTSASHFSTAYRSRFGHTPRSERTPPARTITGRTPPLIVNAPAPKPVHWEDHHV